jgi:ABC-type Na+ efflux pump permease subunit
MILLPIVERELRVASRRPWTYRGRFLAAILAVAFGCVTLVTEQARPGSWSNGHSLLTALAALVFLYTAVAGTQLTCDSLSRERREGTLGFLFLTDLRDYDIVLGKLVAGTLNAAYGMLAVMPVLAVSLILGGTTGGEFWRVALVSANLLFFFSCAGMLSSALCRRDQSAPVAAVALAFSVLSGAPVLLIWWHLLHPAFDPVPFFPFCPAYGCFAAFNDLYTRNAAAFWWDALVTQCCGWIFLLLACRRLRRSWRDDAAGVKESAGVHGEKWRAWVEGTSASRRAERDEMLAINPFLFRATHSRVNRMMPWLFLAALAALWAAVSPVFHWALFEDHKDAVTATLLHFAFKLWVAGDAFRCLAEDRRNGALELLLTTPLTGPEIVKGQRKALWRQFTAPAAAVLGVDFVFMAVAIHHSASVEAGRFWAGFYFSGAVFLVLDMSSLGWIGMRVAMSGRRAYRVVMFWYGGMAVASLLIALLVAVCCSMPDGSADAVCFAAFMVALPATFHLMYSSVPQIALRERFLEIARESDGQMPAFSNAN